MKVDHRATRIVFFTSYEDERNRSDWFFLFLFNILSAIFLKKIISPVCFYEQNVIFRSV